MAFTRAVISSPETGLVFHSFGRRNIMHAAVVQTGGTAAIQEAFPEPGWSGPIQTHSRQDEVFRVLGGRLRFRGGNDDGVGTESLTMTLPRLVLHGFENISDSRSDCSRW